MSQFPPLIAHPLWFFQLLQFSIHKLGRWQLTSCFHTSTDIFTRVLVCGRKSAKQHAPYWIWVMVVAAVEADSFPSVSFIRSSRVFRRLSRLLTFSLRRNLPTTNPHVAATRSHMVRSIGVERRRSSYCCLSRPAAAPNACHCRPSRLIRSSAQAGPVLPGS